MLAEERVVLANAGTLSRSRLATIDLGPAVRDALDGDITTCTTDFRVARALGPTGVFASWFEFTDGRELAILRMPRERERLAMLLANMRMAADHIALVGHNQAGIRGAPAVIRAHVGEPRTLDARAHCRLLLAETTVRAHSRLEDWRTSFQALDLKIVSYPGVFSHGSLDPATQMLASALPSMAGASALDLGCGTGVLTACMAARGAVVTALDVDALALAATAETLRANEVVASVLASDIYSDVDGRFDLIVSNPPFHRGIRTSATVAARMIEEAPARLARGGELWIVANRFLDYPERLRARFRHVDDVAGDAKYRVLRARA